MRRLAAVLTAGLALAGCGSAGGSAPPTWKPKPSFQGENFDPRGRQPIAPARPSGAPGTPTPSSSAPRAGDKDPNVVATGLNAPTGIALLPDNTALVGERTTGRIVRVQPLPRQPVRTVRTIGGLSTSGGGGLLDLAVSPNYAQDKLIFAYLTTPTDNRVVDFTLDGPVTPVLTGIPRGTSDNVGRIAFQADGSLLVGTGDAGRAALADDPTSLAGKVLRVTDIGAAARGNPTPGSKVWTSGHRRVDGLCPMPNAALVFETESRPLAPSDPVNLLRPGTSFGWPRPDTDYQRPVVTLPQTSRSPGGCAVLDDRLFVTSLDGTALLGARIATDSRGAPIGVADFAVALRGVYGRLLTVVAATDGALWLTTSNRDGHGIPTGDDERVLRIIPSGGNTGDAT